MSELEGRSKETARTSRDAFEYAQSEGLGFRFPLANELFVDIDSKEAKATFDRNFMILADAFKFRGTTHTPSRRKKDGIHIVVSADRTFTALERIALQAALASDPAREAHSLIRYADGDPLPTLFFEKKETK
jgi:hypothetical protein